MNNHEKTIVHAKKNYCGKKLHEHIGNPKGLWNFFKQLTNGESNKKSSKWNLLNDFDIMLENQSDVAQEFNRYFAQVGASLANALPIQMSLSRPLRYHAK